MGDVAAGRGEAAAAAPRSPPHRRDGAGERPADRPIADIEDFALAGGGERLSSGARGVRLRPRAAAATEESAAAAAEQVPGSHSIWVKTYGCSHNHSDSEYMCGLLAQYGYRLVGDELKGSADLWLVNSCTVKNPSQEHLASDVRRAKAANKPIVVAGCVSQAEPDLEFIAGLSIVGVQQIGRVVEVVRQALEGNTVRLLGKAERPELELPKIRKNRLVEIIACNTGCLGACTYCKTVHARGRLGSYPPAALASRVRTALSEGVVEVWLTSEDTGAYGRDIGSSMPELMQTLLEALPDGCMLRVGMTNPPYMLQHLDAIVRLLRHPRCYAFLHIPVQSGSNAVLTEMNREYTVEQFYQVAEKLLSEVPDMTIATDIICGFPGETEQDHAQTLAMLDRFRFPVVNISQFYPRPGTPAARMKRVPTHVVKERSREVSAFFASYTSHEHLLDSKQQVLVTDIASDGKHYVAHTKGYVQVLLAAHASLMGATALVRVTEVAKFYVRGHVLEIIHQPPRSLLADGQVASRAPAKSALHSSGDWEYDEGRGAHPAREHETTGTTCKDGHAGNGDGACSRAHCGNDDCGCVDPVENDDSHTDAPHSNTAHAPRKEDTCVTRRLFPGLQSWSLSRLVIPAVCMAISSFAVVRISRIWSQRALLP
ncbi:hypothetical protein AB1Y20_014526 [Prymnesium parvum]|uniref:Threonylcarbamoyladenosine tRNA methylthiotransferase n=1 Tax=Prymnesium parvum TaxID=97485 RepID=A0AB34IDN6_PRYPA